MSYIPLNARGANIVRAPDKTITFTGAAGAGAVGNVTVYTITGRVLLVYFPPAFCTTLLTEAGATATVSLGVTSAVTLFIGATNSVDIDASEWWATTLPAAGYGIMPADVGGYPYAISENIVIACAAQNTNAGVLVFQGLHYIPLTAGASLA